MQWVNMAAVIQCGHDGRVENVPSQRWVTVATLPVLVDDDPEGRTIVACPNVGPTMKPCARTLKVISGYSGWLRIDGQRIALSSVDGLTDGTLPGTVHYTVRDPGQQHVRADG
jgi:hypothetical protein